MPPIWLLPGGPAGGFAPLVMQAVRPASSLDINMVGTFAMPPADMALSVDIRFYLRQWEGSYTLEWQGGDAAVVRFEKEGDLKGEP